MTSAPLAVITGASTGIGLELARELVARGYDAVICAEEPRIEQAALDLTQRAEGTVTAVRADLATEDGVGTLLDTVRELHRPVDVLALNAGIGSAGPFLEQPWRDEARLVALNINHVLAVTRGLVPDMVQQGSGRVMITSSVAGTMPGPWYATYAASKAFLHSFAQALRFELRGTGVSVTSLLPGPTDTEFFDRARMQDTEVYDAKKDDPADVARDGVAALLKGADVVVAGSITNRLQVFASNLLPEQVKARLHSRMTRAKHGPDAGEGDGGRSAARPVLDHGILLIRKGYAFGDALRARSDDPGAGSRVGLRLLGGNALLVRGEKAVRLFYDTDRVQRGGAMPAVVGGGLFGKGSVHGLDGAAHRNRKAMFVTALMDPASVSRVLETSAQEWTTTIQERWLDGGSYPVYDAAVEVYGRSLLRWAGVETDPRTATRIAHAEAAIVDGFAVLGPAWIRTKVHRRRCDAWFRGQIRLAREGQVTPPLPDSPFDHVLRHREPDGQPLPDHLAAVELQNAIRPGIAVCRFAAFAALAMHEHPDWREQVAAEVVSRGSTTNGPVAVAFAEEVRRYYPFVPLLPAVARHDLEFDGATIAAGDRVLLDIYGTNRDERHWASPGRFDPSRFLGTGEAFAEYFVPQGGGRPETGHRCPGEMITVGLLAQTVAELSRLDAMVSRDGLDWPMDRMPTAPRNGVLLSEVGRRG